MNSQAGNTQVSKRRLGTSRFLTALAVIFLLVKGIAKALRDHHVIEANARLGYPDRAIVATGCLLLARTLLYAHPRTSVLEPFS
jgi:hypothetical protein